MYIAGIGQAVIELLSFKIRVRESLKGNLPTSKILGQLR